MERSNSLFSDVLSLILIQMSNQFSDNCSTMILINNIVMCKEINIRNLNKTEAKNNTGLVVMRLVYEIMADILNTVK